MPSRDVLPPLPTEITTEATAQVDQAGRLVLPADVAARWSLHPGDRVRVSANGHQLTVTRSPHHLVKLYVEATTRCNLACRTCLRRTWDEPTGDMAFDLYQQVLDQARAMPDLRLLSFGGIGEPLAHPHLPEMVARAKAQGLSVELVTNGLLLEPDLARALIESELDRLWLSIDGTTPASYDDVRGARLQNVLNHVRDLGQIQRDVACTSPELGIAFVALKRNVADLAALPHFARRLGATRVMVTNVLPYTRELADEILYDRALFLPHAAPLPQVNLPDIDWGDQTSAILTGQLERGTAVNLMGTPLDWPRNTCRFIQQGCTMIGWDGRVVPCMGLLHPYTTFLHGYERQVHAYSLGNVADRPLAEIWRDPEYAAFRERVAAFDFAPCTLCGGCDDLESNKTDCFGSPFPACGGCLWAQGIIQCP